MKIQREMIRDLNSQLCEDEVDLREIGNRMEVVRWQVDWDEIISGLDGVMAQVRLGIRGQKPLTPFVLIDSLICVNSTRMAWTGPAFLRMEFIGMMPGQRLERQERCLPRVGPGGRWSIWLTVDDLVRFVCREEVLARDTGGEMHQLGAK